MLKLDLNKKDKKYLTKVFNQYCQYVYDRKYPLTENNFKLFIKEVFLFYSPDMKNYSITLRNNYCYVSYWKRNSLFEAVIFEETSLKLYSRQISYFNDRLNNMMIKKYADNRCK